MGDLVSNQSQMITFVMVDASNTEVTGLGGVFTVAISKAGGVQAAGLGAKAEIGHGWYRYTLTAAETDTPGPLSIYVTGAGCVQQNLEYVVATRSITAIAFTYTVTNSLTGLPIEGVQVWVSTDVAGANVIWAGVSDAFGVARDAAGNLPRLDPGTVYFWRQKAGFTFSDPDSEVAS